MIASNRSQDEREAAKLLNQFGNNLICRNLSDTLLNVGLPQLLSQPTLLQRYASRKSRLIKTGKQPMQLRCAFHVTRRCANDDAEFGRRHQNLDILEQPRLACDCQ